MEGGQLGKHSVDSRKDERVGILTDKTNPQFHQELSSTNAKQGHEDANC